jgi:hypothetical protein
MNILWILQDSNICNNFSGIKKIGRRTFVPRPVDPESLTAGAWGHVSWRADQVGWVKDPARPSFTGAGDRRWPGGGGARAWEEEGKRVLRDRKLTKNPPGRLSWPETDRRRWILQRGPRVPAGKMATPVAIRCSPARFIQHRGRGRRARALGHGGGA